MRTLSEKDWEYREELIISNAIQSLVERSVSTGGVYLTAWLTIFYREYSIGSWNKKIPDPDSLEDEGILLWDEEEWCIFHRDHPKFGTNIIEAINPHILENFVFFDYACLSDAFDVFDRGKGGLYIPTYYAQVEDRYDYENFV